MDRDVPVRPSRHIVLVRRCVSFGHLVLACEPLEPELGGGMVNFFLHFLMLMMLLFLLLEHWNIFAFVLLVRVVSAKVLG